MIMNTVNAAKKMASLFDGSNSVYTKAANGGESKKLLHIVNDDPLEFETTVSKALTTTTELSMQINEVIRPLFSDWYGCEVIPDSNGGIIVNFVFKALNNAATDEKRAFVPIASKVDKTSNATIDRVFTINMINSSKNQTMDITQYGAEMIYDLMNNKLKQSVNPNKPETMRGYIAEVAEQVAWNSPVQNIYCTVAGIDIYKLLGVVFGVKDGEDSVVYKVTPIRPVGTANIGRSNYIIEIERMRMSKYNEAMTKIGMMPMPGAITAVTGTIGDMRR